jgi:hypothetical protein
MIDAPPRALPAGALGELFRRIGMELGAIPPPAGTQRVQRTVSIPLRAGSINETALKSRSFDRQKVELQGLLMREFHRLQFLLPRPIPSVGHDDRRAPVWAHVRLRFPRHAQRDIENFRTLVAKALGDALTGPFWRGTGPNRRRADRTLIFRGAAYTGGWLENDTHHDWILTMDLDEAVGPPRISVALVWDEQVV